MVLFAPLQLTIKSFSGILGCGGLIIMGDVQRHIHYERTPFMKKMFYVGVGAALYWFAFAGGCQKTKALYSHAMENTPQPIAQIYSSCDRLAGNTLDARVR